MPKEEGTTEETTHELVWEDGKRRVKTTTVTTIVKKKDGGYQTRTKTATMTRDATESDEENCSKGDTSKLDKKMKKLNVSSDSEEEKAHDPKNAMSRADTKEFRNDLLFKINDFRRSHKATGLRADSKIEDIAQEHANKMLKNDKISLLSDTNYGQTLAMKSPRPKGEKIAEMWYGGKEEYKGEFSQPSGNFSQLVWIGSTKIGIGVASNKDGKTYIIALYDPPGNVKGKFDDNVKA